MKRKFEFQPLNDFFNVQATPEEVKSRLSELAINYARTANEYSLADMRSDLDFLSLLIECIGQIKPQHHE